MYRAALLKYIRNINLNFAKNLTKSTRGEDCPPLPPISQDCPPPTSKERGARGPFSKEDKKLKHLHMLQEKFQIKDGNPIFIKNGHKDKMLFQFTNVLMAIGLVMSVYTIYSMAFDAHSNARSDEDD